MRQPRARLPLRTQSALSVNPTPVRFTLIRPQSGRAKAKPLNMHNKKLTPGRSLGPNEALGGPILAREYGPGFRSAARAGENRQNWAFWGFAAGGGAGHMGHNNPPDDVSPG